MKIKKVFKNKSSTTSSRHNAPQKDINYSFTAKFKAVWPFGVVRDKILFYGIIMELLFALLFFVDFPLRKIFNDYAVSPVNEIILGYLFLIFTGLFLVYFLIYNFARKNKDKLKDNFKIIIFFFILFQLTLLFIPPMGSADVYNYVFRTKVLTHYHENPYFVPAGNFGEDPLADHALNRGGESPLIYGSLWLGISILPTVLSNGTVVWGPILFKLVAIIFNMGVLYLVFKILSILKPKYKNLGLIVYAFNPWILFEVANNGHNDIAMVFFIMLGFYLWIKNKHYLSIVALTASFLVKFVPLLILPVATLLTINTKKNLKEKIKFLILSILIFLLLIYLNYLVAGGNPNMLSGVGKQAKAYSLIHMSPLPFILEMIPSLEFTAIKKIIGSLFLTLYLFLVLRIIIKKERTINSLIKYTFFIFSLYLLIASTWLMPWYFLWIIPFAIILDYKIITLALTFFSFSAYTLAFPTLSYFLLILIIASMLSLNKLGLAVLKK